MVVDILSEKRVRMVACGEEHIGCLVAHGWVPDDEAKGCMACRKTFTAIRRRVSTTILIVFYYHSLFTCMCTWHIHIPNDI